MVQLKRQLFSALSWRVEAGASALSPDRGQQVRQQVGRIMRWTRAHDTLPDIEGRAAILCFHGVVSHQRDREVEADMLEVREFRKLLRVLNRSFRVISLTELVNALQEHRPPPARSIVLTFDDGYANNATIAAEELSAMKMPWSEFLPAALIENKTRQWIDEVRILIHRGGCPRLRLQWDEHLLQYDLRDARRRREAIQRIHQICRYVPDSVRRSRLHELYGLYTEDEIESLCNRYPSFLPMSWKQARELKSAGVDVGSHSLNHVALAQQPPQEIRNEILAARDLLQQRIGDHSPHFSYPYGRAASISTETESVLTEADYHCALTLDQDVIHGGSENLMRLPRLIVSPLVGRVLFGLWQRFIR